MSGNRGLVLALITALVSGISVFVNGVAVKLADPFVYTTLKNFGALAFILIAALALGQARNLLSVPRNRIPLLVLIGIVGGSIPFLLFFWGLKLGGPAVSSFIYRSLFIFAGVFGYFILRENPSPREYAGAFVILLGNALLVSGDLALGPGQLLVFGATILWALEYTISRKALAEVHPSAVMASRMLFGSIVLFTFLAISGSLPSLASVSQEILLWLLLTSLLLAGFLLAWYNCLKHLPVLRATSILALGGVVTAALDAFFLGKAFTPVEGFGLLLIVVGVAIAASLKELFEALREPEKSLVA